MPEAVRYRPLRRQLPWYVAIYPVLATGRFLAANRPGSEKVAVVAAVALVLACVFAESWMFGVGLRPDALVVYGVRRRVVPWRDVQGIDVTTRLGTRCVAVRTRGSVFRLRAPTDTPVLGPDPDFTAKVEAIRAYWLAATSAGSAP